MVLGTQLGKTNIAAWASKEEEDKDASTSLKTVAVEQPAKSVIETRAAAWEEAERAKYIARLFHSKPLFVFVFLTALLCYLSTQIIMHTSPVLQD